MKRHWFAHRRPNPPPIPVVSIPVPAHSSLSSQEARERSHHRLSQEESPRCIHWIVLRGWWYLPQNVNDHEDLSFSLFDRNVPRNESDNHPHISLPEGLRKNIPHPPKVRKGNHPRRVKVPSLLYLSLFRRLGLGRGSLAGEFLEGVTIRWDQVL